MQGSSGPGEPELWELTGWSGSTVGKQRRKHPGRRLTAHLRASLGGAPGGRRLTPSTCEMGACPQHAARVTALSRERGRLQARKRRRGGAGAGPGSGARPQGRPGPESQWPRQPGRQRRWRRATATVSAGRRSGAGWL